MHAVMCLHFSRIVGDFRPQQAVGTPLPFRQRVIGVGGWVGVCQVMSEEEETVQKQNS